MPDNPHPVEPSQTPTPPTSGGGTERPNISPEVSKGEIKRWVRQESLLVEAAHIGVEVFAALAAVAILKKLAPAGDPAVVNTVIYGGVLVVVLVVDRWRRRMLGRSGLLQARLVAANVLVDQLDRDLKSARSEIALLRTPRAPDIAITAGLAWWSFATPTLDYMAFKSEMDTWLLRVTNVQIENRSREFDARIWLSLHIPLTQPVGERTELRLQLAPLKNLTFSKAEAIDFSTYMDEPLEIKRAGLRRGNLMFWVGNVEIGNAGGRKNLNFGDGKVVLRLHDSLSQTTDDVLLQNVLVLQPQTSPMPPEDSA